MKRQDIKICVITCTRAEYGLLKNVVRCLKSTDGIECQLVVGGAHLLDAQGKTIQMIQDDGNDVDYVLDYLSGDDSEAGIIRSMAKCTELCAACYEALQPDMILVLGDRYELLPICSTALVMRIPIAHISGGDVTIGAIDNEIRNAVTMMADLHFPGTDEAATNIIRMRGSDKNVYNVGEIGIENLANGLFIERSELSKKFGWNANKKWLLVTLHPETKMTTAENAEMAETLMRFISKIKDVQIIVTYANADCGGQEMNRIYESYAKRHDNIYLYPSLGQANYNSTMSEAYCVIGNTSSGIVEAPILAKPVINIGLRQEGRHRCSNIIDVPVCTEDNLRDAMTKVQTMNLSPDNYWGDGNSSIEIVKEIKHYFEHDEK